MLIDSSVVGAKSEVKKFEVEKGAIRSFAQAIGDKNPLFLEEEFAKKHGFKSIIAPPTFPTTFRVPIPEMKIELSRVLHGEQQYAYTRPIVAGEHLYCVNEVIDAYERQGSMGMMTFLVTETSGKDAFGNAVFNGKSTIILH